jgi:[protein-PII] uridylyltransferase
VLPTDPHRPPSGEEIETALRHGLSGPLDRLLPARRTQPRHLRHFRIAPQVTIDTVADGLRSQLSLICTDRPGLLADVAHVLRQHRVRVHDARIGTFGERAEDVLLLSGGDDRALPEAEAQALRQDLIEALDGGQR